MTDFLTLNQALVLEAGEIVRLLVDGAGEVDFSDHEDADRLEWEREFEAGCYGVIESCETFKGRQGFAVTVTILNGPGAGISNTFDEGDCLPGKPLYPFERLDTTDKADACRDALISELSGLVRYGSTHTHPVTADDIADRARFIYESGRAGRFRGYSIKPTPPPHPPTGLRGEILSHGHR